MTILNPVTLETVEQEFSNWRAIKKGGEKIPEHLWDQVKTLLKHYKRTQVLKRLGITIRQARESGAVMCSIQLQPTHKKIAPFIEIPMLAKPTTYTAPHIPVLTLKHGELLLSLEYPTEAQLHLFLNTLVR